MYSQSPFHVKNCLLTPSFLLHIAQLPRGLSDLIQKALDQLTDLQEAMEEDSDDGNEPKLLRYHI